MSRRAQRLLFGLAAAWAALVLPLFVLQHTRGIAVFAEAGSLLHGREMLLGYLLPVIAGYLRPTLRVPLLGGFVSAWALGRVGAFAGPDWFRLAMDLAQAVMFAIAVVPALLRGAKKWRNRALPLLLVAVALLTGLFFGVGGSGPAAHALLRDELLLSLTLLLLFMGGRLLVPLLRGHAARTGMPRPPGLQPRIEGALLGIAFAAMAAHSVGQARAAGALTLAAGCLAMARMVRWGLWRYTARPDLMALLAGQLWTVGAAGILGIAWLAGREVGTASLHVLTVGGVGTMTATVTAFALLHGARAGRILLPVLALLLAASAISRLAADAGPPAEGMLAVSAACWSAAWLAVLAIALFRRPGGRRP